MKHFVLGANWEGEKIKNSRAQGSCSHLPETAETLSSGTHSSVVCVCVFSRLPQMQHREL